MKTITLRRPDGSVLLTFTVANEATPEEVAAEAERRVGALRAQGESPTVGAKPHQPPLRPPPPPPGGDLDQQVRCGVCPWPGPTWKRGELTKHMAEVHPEVFGDRPAN